MLGPSRARRRSQAGGQDLGTGMGLVRARIRDRQGQSWQECSAGSRLGPWRRWESPEGPSVPCLGMEAQQHLHSQCPNSTKKSSFPGDPTQPFWLAQSHRVRVSDINPLKQQESSKKWIFFSTEETSRMCEEGECSLLGSESCSLSCRFHSSQDQSPPAALAACGDSDDSRWRAMLCSRRIFLPENRHREPDPRTAGPPWQEKGQQQPGQSLGDTTATVSPPGTALSAAQGLGGGLCPHSWFSGILDWRHHMDSTSLEPQFIPLGSSRGAEGADAQEHKIPKYSSGLS